MNLHDYDITTMAKEAGIEEGREMERVEAAKKMLRMNLGTHEQIAQVQDLPLKKVQELAEEITAEKKEETVLA